MATQIGIVSILIGTATATAADGTVRNLQVGDKIYADELISTGPGGAVEIEFADGTLMDIGRSSQLVLDDAVYNPDAVAELAPTDDTDGIQQAILAGVDPTQVTEATAAGAGTEAAGNEGVGFVTVDYLAPEVTPESGFDTTGISVEFPVIEEEILGPEDDLPVVSISVEIEIDVEDPQDPPPPGGDPTPDNPVVVSGNAASVLEGTGDAGRDITFLLSLDQAFDQDVDVTYELRPITADHPADWFNGDLVNTVTIPAGDTTFPVTVTIVQDHLDEDNEVFDIVLLSATNATINPAADSAIVTIFDDDTTPVANPDTNWVQAVAGESQREDEEDSELPSITGNVLNNIDHTYDPAPGEDGDEILFQDDADTDEDGDSLVVTGVVAHGDDGALGGGDDTVGTIGSPVDGKYGTLTLQSNGGYLYVASPETMDLTFGQSVQDQFTYTVTDTYNTPQTTTLTITIFGGDSGVEITNLTPQIEGGDVLVDEDDLPGGTDGSQSTTQQGTFNIDAPDGVGNLSINGNTVISNNLFTATSFTTPDGNTLSVTDYDPNTGEVTYTYELEDSETHSVQGEDSIYENLTVNLTDTDGDFTSGILSVQIVDDMPSVVVNATNEANVVLTTQDADTVGVASDTASTTADFSGVFTASPTYGADGAGSTSFTSYSLALASGVSNGDDSGLNSGGADVLIRDVGGVIEGYVGSDVIFSISVNGSGVVTLTQNEVLDHVEGGALDDFVALGSGLVELTAQATVTDFDGDTATNTASVDLGDNIRFEDDEPSVVVNAANEANVVLTTQDADTVGVASDTASTTADFSGVFTASPTYGADGAGSTSFTSYSLALASGVSNGDDSGLNSGGADVLIRDVGGVIEGYVRGDVIFSISVNGSGVVTLTQNEVLDHVEGGALDDIVALGSGLVELTAEATVTDFDGDTATNTASVDLGDNIRFEDDEPLAVADTNSVTEGSSVNGNVLTDGTDDAFGADGPATTVPAGGVVGVATSGTPSGGSGVGSGVPGSYGTLTLNADGSYTYVSTADAITGNEQDIFVYTIEDADGDTSTTTLTIDVSDVTLVADNDEVTVDEAALPAGSDPGSTDETAGGTLAVPGAITYAFKSGTDGTGSNGTLTLNANGTYSYTLTAAVASGLIAGANTVNAVETFEYTATDANGNTVNGTIVVNVIDDIPSISSPDGTIKNAALESLDGIIDFDLGADGAGGVSLSLISSPVDLTSNDHTVLYEITDNDSDGFEELRAYTVEDGTVFTISQDGSDSQYSLDMNGVLDLTDTFTNSFANGVTGNGPTGSVDFATTDGTENFVIRLSSPDDVNNSAGKIGVDNQNMNTDETLTIEFLTDDLSGSYDVNGITLGLFNFGSGESFTYTLHSGATQVGSGTVSGPLDDSQPLVGTSNYDRIEIDVVNGNFKFDDISGQSSTSFDAIFELGAVVSDSDVDATPAAAGTYTITIGNTLDTILGTDDDIPVS